MPIQPNTEESKNTDFIKNSKNLLNATSNVSTGLKEVLQVLYGFLMSISSTNPWFVELRKELDEQDPTFLQKIKITYIYYYVNYIKAQYHFKQDYMKDPEKAKQELGNLSTFLEGKESQYFLYLLDDSKSTEEYSPFKDTELASAFLKGIFKIHSEMFRNGDSKDIKNATMEDFFKDLGSLSKEKNISTRTKGLAKWIESSDPAIKTMALLGSEADLATYGHTAIHIDLKDIQTEVGDWFNHIKDREVKSWIFSFWEKFDNQKMTDELHSVYTEESVKLIGKIKEKEDNKKSDEPKHEDTFVQPNIEDKLAMNMADYITGRISASEFQKRDQLIKSSKGSIQNLEETQPSL